MFSNDIYEKLLIYMKFKANLDVSTHQIAQSGRYTYHAKSIFYLRISTLPLSLGVESCVIRLILNISLLKESIRTLMTLNL